MKVLVIGGGGREHALAWKIAGDSTKPDIFCAPGNAGTADIATNLELAATDIEGLKSWAVRERPDLTVVGPEAPLCMGIADMLEQESLAVFGPGQQGARLEGSKIFAKEIMLSAKVPTAPAEIFDNADDACAYARKRGAPLVVKADGLAAGKGVSVCASVEAAEAAIRKILDQKIFGEAGCRILIEDCLEGEEASVLALVDGEKTALLASSQDHKRALDGDKGPNTGGMGAYSPTPIMDDKMRTIVERDILAPIMDEFKRRNIVYRGVLYVGLMITKAGPMVLEFNCRLGDPETQAVLPRWSGDILPALIACTEGKLEHSLIRWDVRPAVCIVMASGGYPGSYEKGFPIEGLDPVAAMEDVFVFHAGTAKRDGHVVTSGGRVLGITALGDDLESAVKKAYGAVNHIHFQGAFFRNDIAWRALGDI